MAAQELRWLTYLLTDLGEQPRSPPILYVDNKAMLALCREQRLEHRTKHIALRYFLARELQQRGQLRLAYVASEANTADIFTKAVAPDCVVGSRSRWCSASSGDCCYDTCPRCCSCGSSSALSHRGCLPPWLQQYLMQRPGLLLYPLLLWPQLHLLLRAGFLLYSLLPAAADRTPALLSPAVAAIAPAAAVVTLALLSPDATSETGAGAGAGASAGAVVVVAAAATAVVTPPLLSLGAAVTLALLSPDAPTETAAAAAAIVPSQTALAPPSPTCLNAAHGSGNIHCAA
ncbi:unnamed protein product [Closterium sp. NIES-54]